MWRMICAGALLFCLVLSRTAIAEGLEAPVGPPILTVSGQLGERNVGDAAVFDLAMLQALPSTQIITTTIWTDDVQVFEGVSLHGLLEILDVDAGTIRATAINDYAVEIPIDDAVEGGPIIAFMRNGAPMMVRDKGPLWIIYPYDSTLEYNSQEIYSRSIWQLNRIEILP